MWKKWLRISFAVTETCTWCTKLLVSMIVFILCAFVLILSIYGYVCVCASHKLKLTDHIWSTTCLVTPCTTINSQTQSLLCALSFNYFVAVLILPKPMNTNWRVLSFVVNNEVRAGWSWSKMKSLSLLQERPQ